MVSIRDNKYKTALYSALVFILFFALLEIAARTFLVIKYYYAGESLFYGLTHIQERVKFKKIEHRDGTTSYHIGVQSSNRKNPVNSRGFRGPEVALNKQKRTRIACIGSSTTYGDGLEYIETYPAILQKNLNRMFGDDHFEVINAGQSGLLLKQILPLTEHEVLPLNPDIYIFMNINNNLDARGYWFIDVQGNETKDRNDTKESLIRVLLQKGRDLFVSKTALGHSMNLLFKPGLTGYFLNFDWEGFAYKTVEPDNLWERDYRKNVRAFVEMVFKHSPGSKIIFLEEAVNADDYPSMNLPFELAKKALRETSTSYTNVYCLDVQGPILQAAVRDKQVWQNPSFDPLHLSGRGNEVLARVVADFISECCAGY